MRMGKILTFIGVGLYVFQVISSRSDANGNALAPYTLILISVTAIILYILIVAAALWKIKHKGMALLLPIALLSTGAAVFLTPNTSFLNTAINAIKFIAFVTYFRAVWLMFASDRKQIVTH